MRLRSEDKHHLRKSADRKAQISPVSGTNAFLICAFRSADFLRWCLSSERSTISFSISNSFWYYRKRGSASYIVREVLSVRERERDTERETDGSDVTIVALKLAMIHTFPCQKFALFVSPFTLPLSPFTERSPLQLWRWNSQKVHTFHCQKIFRLLCSPSFKWHEPRDEWSKTQDKWPNRAQSYFVLPIEKMNQINTKHYWK